MTTYRWACVRCGSALKPTGECTRFNCTEKNPPPKTPKAIPLDCLGGPAEVMEAAGLTNRGSLDWAMKHRGFPRPVKRLQRIRIWDLGEVEAWKINLDIWGPES